MPITLIATPGAANANSFTELAWADSYIAQTAFPGPWTASTDDEKKAALITVTNALNTLLWQGYRVTSTQALAFPRSGLLDRDQRWPLSSTDVPFDIQAATAEGAHQLLEDEVLPSSVPASAGIKRLKAGSVEIEFTDKGQPQGSWLPDQVLAICGYLLARAPGMLNVPLVRA